MELRIEDLPTPPLDQKVAYRCDICDYNPYREWCRGNIARFQNSYADHILTKRHKRNIAIANGEEVADDKPHFYISKLEQMISKLERRIAEMDEKQPPLERGDEPPTPRRSPSPPSPPSTRPPTPTPMTTMPPRRRFEWRTTERKALMDYDNGSIINITNIFNALSRCYDWCEVYMVGDKKDKNMKYIRITRDLVKQLLELQNDGWNADEEDYEAVGDRLDKILTHQFVA